MPVLLRAVDEPVVPALVEHLADAARLSRVDDPGVLRLVYVAALDERVTRAYEHVDACSLRRLMSVGLPLSVVAGLAGAVAGVLASRGAGRTN